MTLLQATRVKNLSIDIIAKLENTAFSSLSFGAVITDVDILLLLCDTRKMVKNEEKIANNETSVVLCSTICNSNADKKLKKKNIFF